MTVDKNAKFKQYRRYSSVVERALRKRTVGGSIPPWWLVYILVFCYADCSFRSWHRELLPGGELQSLTDQAMLEQCVCVCVCETLAECLPRWPAGPVCSARESQNPTDVYL